LRRGLADHLPSQSMVEEKARVDVVG
jgi:hypothetical protein